MESDDEQIQTIIPSLSIETEEPAQAHTHLSRHRMERTQSNPASVPGIVSPAQELVTGNSWRSPCNLERILWVEIGTCQNIV
jgi:hypothetical protein